MPTGTYDLIVVGDELSGLVAATLCASRGMRVLLVESGDRRWSYQVGPFILPTAPLPLPGLGGPGMRRVIEELHFEHLLKRKLVEPEPPLQLVAPDLRLDVGPDPLELSTELDRELPGAGADTLFEGADRVSGAVDPLFSGDLLVPAGGFFERREVTRLESALEAAASAWGLADADSLLRSLVSLPAVAGSHRSVDELGPAAIARALSSWRRSVPRLPGDAAALREILLDKFASHNGERRTGWVDEITTGWNKVTGVRLQGGDDFDAGHVIAAMPVAELAPLFGKKVPKRLRQLADGVEVAGYRYTLHIVIDEIGAPEGMARTVLMVGDPDAPLTGDNAIALYLDRPDDRARVVISAQALCPAPEVGTSLEDAFASLRIAIERRLGEVMPFYREHVLTVHSPLESTAPTGYDDRVEPIAAPPVWRSTLPPESALAILDYGVGIKHLSLASTQILPELGLEGEMVAGWCAAKLACASAGKKKDFNKPEVLAVRSS